MKARIGNVVLFGFPLFCVLLFVLVQRLEMRAKGAVAELDMRSAISLLPTKLNTGKGVLIADWELIEDEPSYYTFPPPGPFSDQTLANMRVFTFVDRAYSYVIQVFVIDYRYPWVAQTYMSINEPARRISQWNFAYAPEDIEPSSWRTNSEAADELPQCGEGTEENCSVWFYQARFGQYYVLVEATYGLDVETFNRIVDVINSQVIQAVGD